MNKKLLFAFCTTLFTIFFAGADNVNPLGDTDSKMKYKFSIPKEIMYDYQTGKLKDLPLDILTNPIDSIPFSEKLPDIKHEQIGTFVWCWFENGALNVKPVNNVPFKVFVCPTNTGDVLVKVLDNNANNIQDAVVIYNGKKIKYNPESHSYYSKYRNNKFSAYSEITVEHDGYLKKVKESESCFYYNNSKYYVNVEHNNFINSFFTTDKPIYRPGDTLRWKAVVLDFSGKWYDNDLTLSTVSYPNKKINLGTVKPKNKGVYYGELILNDSIMNHFKTGNYYSLSLSFIDKKGEDNIIKSTNFLYKDYELKSLNTKINVPEQNIIGKDIIVSLQNGNKKIADNVGLEVITTDEKGDAVMAGSINAKYYINAPRVFKADYIWYPDTSFAINVPINTNGKTFVPINLPKLADGNYTIGVSLEIATADFEKVTSYRSMSVIIDSDINKSMTVDNIFSKIKSEKNSFYNETFNEYPRIIQLHTIDSVGFSVKDCGVDLLYAIYKDGKLLKTETARTIDWSIRTIKDGRYDMDLFFKFDNAVTYTRLSSTINHSKYALDVKVEQPEVIAPGEKAKIRISVTDPKGKPVVGADVLAHAYTDKFNTTPHGIDPWTYKKQKVARYYPYFNYNPSDRNQVEIRRDFDEELLKLFKLAYSEYYDFLYPAKDKFQYSLEDKNGSQIAPFVVNNGRIEPVVYLTIDGKVVYIGIAENEQPYTFPVKPGKHNVVIHTIKGDYYLNNIYVEEGRKVWVSVPYDIYDREDKSGDVYAYKRKETYTQNDIMMLVRYGLSLMNVRPAVGFPYLSADKNILFLLNSNSSINYYSDYHNGLFFIPYTFSNCRYREIGYNKSVNIPLHNSICEYENFIIPKDTISYINNYNKAIKSSYSAVIPYYNDTLFFEKDLNTFWLDIMDNYRRYTVVNNVVYNKANVHVVENERKVSNRRVMNYVVEFDDSIAYFNGNTNLLPVPYDKKVTIYCLYKGADYYSYNITCERGGKICIKLPADSVILSANEKTRKFEADIREVIQTKIINDRNKDNYNYTGFEYPFREKERQIFYLKDYVGDVFRIRGLGSVSNFDDQSDGEEIAVLGYGHSPKAKSTRSYAVKESAVASAAGMDFVEESEEGVINEVVVETAFNDEAMLDASIDDYSSDITIRQDFRDVAYWVPSVTTDENGVVEIEVDYPEDLTRWVEEFVVMKGKYRGSKISYVTVQKDVVAKLSIPRFAIEGDSIRFVGQSVNYTSDSTMLLERAFWMAKDKNVLAKEFFPNAAVAHSFVDYFSVKLPLLPNADTDTLNVTYTLSNTNKISDGEMRKLPILPQGMSAIDAMFTIAKTGDTSFVYNPNKEHGSVTLYAQTDILSMLLDKVNEIAESDIDKCSNIRLAQVLKALVLKRELLAKNGEKFNEDKKVNKIIKKLEKNCNAGKWGWWNISTFTTMNITNSVYEALIYARKYYTVSSLENKYQSSYLADLQKARVNGDYFAILEYAELFNTLGWKPEALAAISDIPKDTLKSNNLLRYQIIRSRCGEDVSVTDFDTIRNKDLLGGEYYSFNIYPVWARYWKAFPQYNFYFDIESTLLVYKAIEAMPQSEERDQHITAMRRWLLQSRETHQFIGECLSADILFTIAPNLLDKPVAHKPASIFVRSGNNEYRVSKFPYSVNLDSNYPITIIKSGDSEAYISLSQRYWQKQVEKKSGDITINTYFKGGDELTLGKEATLVVELDLTADAEYLLVHAPIPAGCSYADYQPYNHKVTHREDFAHVVNFYIEHLKAGKHAFEIKLLPRWSGFYHLNPASAELYYYPAFNANEVGKKVKIDN